MFLYVHIDRASAGTTSATGTAQGVLPFRYVNELVHKTLTPARSLSRPRVVARSMYRELGKTTRIPASEPLAFRSGTRILYVETRARGAHISAGSASQTTFGLPFPHWRIEHALHFTFEFFKRKYCRYIGQIRFLSAFFINSEKLP